MLKKPNCVFCVNLISFNNYLLKSNLINFILFFHLFSFHQSIKNIKYKTIRWKRIEYPKICSKSKRKISAGPWRILLRSRKSGQRQNLLAMHWIHFEDSVPCTSSHHLRKYCTKDSTQPRGESFKTKSLLCYRII